MKNLRFGPQFSTTLWNDLLTDKIGVSRDKADRMCSFNRNNAEHPGYFLETDFLEDAVSRWTLPYQIDDYLNRR